MTGHEYRGELEEMETNKGTLERMLRTTRKHRRAIAFTMVVLAISYLIVALALYLLIPAQRATELSFRLDFRGAERGQYPNGTKFSASEITSVPVLVRVYKSNDLARFIPFDQFKSSVFVMQSNEKLVALTGEFRAKLSKPDLTAVERSEIEREFQEKKASLSQADYSLVLSTNNRFRGIPGGLRAKVVSDILTTWAEMTVNDKGVSLYDISILSSGVFERDQLAAYDYIIALDLVRSKINRVIVNIDELSALPGAKVLRSGENGRSLAELRVRLVDTVEFRLRPLLGVILSKGISKNPMSSVEFLKTQLTFNELEMEEANARVAAVRDALDTYVQERQQQRTENSKATPSGTVIPQIDESFLNRIVELTGEGNDLAYRQKLVDDLRERAMLVVPLQAEARYYQTMLDSFTGTLRPATREETALIESQFDAIVSDAIKGTAEVNAIYQALSKDLNPSSIIYSVTSPVSSSVTRSVKPSILTLAGFLFLLLALPALVVAFLIYDWTRTEADKDEAEPQQESARSRPGVGAETPADTTA